jgi:glycerol uptake facilitator-like aquaporin
MLKFKLDKWPRGRRHYNPIGGNPGDKADEEVEDWEDPWEPLKHGILEMLASIVVTYSTIYMPVSETDDLKQYVSSICIFAVLITLKDTNYFCPDCTPLTTLMLWAATLYTDIKGRTKTLDIIARVTGQLLGCAVVFGIASGNKYNIDHYATIHSFDSNSTDQIHSSKAIHAVQEGVGTMVECIAIAFAIIPLMSPYEINNKEGNNGIESKVEAPPPTMGNMTLVALALASIHYVLERQLQATMNPPATLLQLYVKDELSNWIGPVFGQLIGALTAVVYIKLCKPNKRTLMKIIARREREHAG